MSNDNQLAFDTDWISATLAASALVLLAAFVGVAAWHVVAGKASTTHVPRISAMEVAAVIFGLWLGVGPRSSRLPRVVRLLILLWVAEFVVHGMMLLAHATTQTWALLSPLESWFHVIVGGLVFVYLVGWLKGTIRRVDRGEAQ